MNKKERLVIINFIKNGLSTRKLDKLLGYDQNKTKGWKSFEILKKYNLKNEYKGRLFLYSDSQCINLVKNLEEHKLDELMENNLPKIFKKYSNSKVLAENEEIFYQVMSGETRNIIQSFFSPLKKIMGICQFKDCNRKDLDTVHLKLERPEIFKNSAKELRVKKMNYFEYPIMKTMIKFLKFHQNKGAICFLCKKHHLELHKLEKGKKDTLNKFMACIKDV